MPRGASVVAPATEAERSALSLFLNWVSDVVEVARENEGRAEVARRTLGCR